VSICVKIYTLSALLRIPNMRQALSVAKSRSFIFSNHTN
jgi:hypothetical protein